MSNLSAKENLKQFDENFEDSESYMEDCEISGSQDSTGFSP